jgi:hypothetical protein
VTPKVHGVPTATVALANAMVTGAVTVNVPPQWELLAVVTVSPVGRVSLNATPVNETGFPAGLVTVKVRVVVPFTAIPVGENDCAIDGGASTFSVADAVRPLPPSVDVIAEVVLVSAPALVPVTFTENVQDPAPARAAPDSVTELLPAVAVIVPPPQDPVSPLGVATVIPEGKVSLKPTAWSVVLALGLLMVKLSEVEALSATVDAPNDLLIVGGATTEMLALAVTPSNVTLVLTVAAALPAVNVEVMDPLPEPGKATGCAVVMLPPDPLEKVTGRLLNTAKWPLRAAVAPELS